MEVFKNMIIDGQLGKPLLTDIFFQDTCVAKPVVVYAHGFNGFKDWGNFDLIARQFADAGFVFIKFNFSHNGTTPEHPDEFVDLDAYGNNNYTKELDDLGAMIDWVLSDHEKSPHINRNRLFLLGHSKGGGVVLIKAAEDKRVSGVVTWASVADAKTPWGRWPSEKMKEWKRTGVQYIQNTRTRQNLPLYYQLYEDYLANKSRLDICKTISRIRVPVLICHGNEDTSVPPGQAIRLHECQPKAELFMAKGDHVFGRKHPWTDNSIPNEMQAVVKKSIDFLLKVGGK